MQSILIFSNPSPICKALIEDCKVLGFATSRFDAECLMTSRASGRGMEDASLVLLLGSGCGSESLPLLMALAVRPRCHPYGYSAPIAVANIVANEQPIPTELIQSVGIHVLQFPQLVAQLCFLATITKKWQTFPSIECRPVWALKVEAAFLEHRTRNAFRWIAEHGTDYTKMWMHDAKKILLPDQTQGER